MRRKAFFTNGCLTLMITEDSSKTPALCMATTAMNKSTPLRTSAQQLPVWLQSSPAHPYSQWLNLLLQKTLCSHAQILPLNPASASSSLKPVMVYLGTCVPRAMLLTLSPNVVEHSQAIKTVSVLIRTAAPDCKHPSSPVGIADPWHSYTEGHGEDTEPSPESQPLLVDIWMSFCPNFKWPLEVLEYT